MMACERELFLRDVEHFGRREHIDPETLKALHEELTDHIDAAVQARLETGEYEPDAVKRSVEALGEPFEIIKNMAEAKGDWRPSAAAMASMIGVYLLAFWSPSGLWAWAELVALLVCLILIGITAWRARRAQWWAGIAVLPVTFLALTFVLSAHYMTLFPGEAPEPRSIDGSYATYERSAKNMGEQLKQYDQAYSNYLRSGTNLVARRFDPISNQLVLKPARSPEIARRTWDLYSLFRKDLVRLRDREAARAKAAYDADHSPFWYEAPNEIMPALSYSLQLAGLAFFFHLAAVFLHWLFGEIDRAGRSLRRRFTSRGGTQAR